MSDRILIIDDDKELTLLLTEYLQLEGFKVTVANDGVSGLAKAYDETLSLILLDVMMPKLNGFEVLKALGNQHAVPILMLTAKGEPHDKVLGLQLGADDYLAKPFNHDELLARMNAILRRVKLSKSTSTKNTIVQVNQVSLNHATREVLCHDKFVEFTGTEYQILDLLIKRCGQIVSKSEISNEILRRKLSPFDRSIDMHISNIRKKLIAINPIDKMKTVRGAGYIFLVGDNDSEY